MLDLAKTHGNDVIVGLIEESIQNNPEVGLFPARPISGTSYKTQIRVGYPTAAFRNANEGADRSKSAFENRLVEAFIIDCPIAADKAVADTWEPGGAAGYQIVEASAALEAVHRRTAKSVYYGNSTAAVTAGLGDAKGFPGFIDAYDNTSSHEVDATDDTALTSVWAVKLGIKDVHFVLGGGQNVLNLLPEWRVETALDSNSKPFTAYCNSLMGWLGMQVGSVNSLVRIKNIGTTTNKGMTDALAQSALELFPSGTKPDYFIMNRRSRKQLRQSRIAVAVGAGFSANSIPTPTEIDGIPIITTDALSNNEGSL